ncbi:uncharacterized protein [Nicotiana sylvestris]|uniref:uncharacterized protein n=1 Tax=Nicotiana sylvestris TaxID=4096 RepID=UPI00388CC50B
MPDTTVDQTTVTSTGNGPNSDPNHPYFLHSSDAPGMSLVNVVFDGKGYQGWKISVLIALSTKNKLGSSMETAQLLLLPPMIFNLGVDVMTWKKIQEKSQEDERLIQFLMGLNEAYGQARGNIIMMNPLPRIDQAYSLILQDENQREEVSPTFREVLPIKQVFYKGMESRNSQVKARNMEMDSKGLTGRTMADRYRIIGFPEEFEFTNKKTGQGIVKSNVALGEQEDDNTNNCTEVKIGDTRSQNSKINANAVAGTIIKYSRICFSVFNSNTWIIDSGHLPFQSMKYFGFVSFPPNSKHFYDICPKAKLTRNPFSLSQIKSKKAFELIHVDTWGPYKVSIYNGYKYFLTIVNDYSRGTWTFSMSTKSNAFDALKNFLTMVER